MPKTPTTEDSLYQSNEEYTKLKSSRQPGEKSTPREQPTRQAPGGHGHTKAEYERWTTEELTEHARGLGIGGFHTMDRDALIEAIRQAEGR